MDYDADSAKASASVLNAQKLRRLLEVVAHGGEGAGPYTLTTYTGHQMLAALETGSGLGKEISSEEGNAQR